MVRHIAPKGFSSTVQSEFYNDLITSNNKTTRRKREKVKGVFAIGFLAIVTLFTIDSSSPKASITSSIPANELFPLSDRSLQEMEKYKQEYAHERPLSSKTTMLLGIFSTNDDEKYVHRRTYIRETYLNTGDPRICKLSEYIHQREYNMHPICQVPYTFIIAAGGKHRPYDHDDKEPITITPKKSKRINDEDDCTYLNIRESMEDGKSATYFKFGAEIASKYGIDYITKLDDDTIPSPTMLMDFIEDELPPSPFNRRIFGGRVWTTKANIYYGAGAFYFLSADLAHHISHNLSAKDRKSLSHFPKTEDADMGKFLFTHDRPLKFVNLSAHQFWEHDFKTEEAFRTRWSEILDPNRKEPRLPRRAKSVPWKHLCPNDILNPDGL
ncbi:hypothetical protein CTEN210_11731 [Chaetoceros tenuissimus]|uniref:Hexosyltransferase n=1 Tax=Chaetoceros tenuissimus TaxID=426638 RepID=A0AAD3D2D4_9STRA|nr:hypothetical protein CTEN210_11731 [Chaetoceros tenuissimus]